MVGVLGLAGLLGAFEGQRRRQGDALAGYRLRLWTLGVLGVPFLFGLVGAYLILPWPLSLVGVAWGVSMLLGITTYALMRGRPTLQ